MFLQRAAGHVKSSKTITLAKESAKSSPCFLKQNTTNLFEKRCFSWKSCGPVDSASRTVNSTAIKLGRAPATSFVYIVRSLRMLRLTGRFHRWCATVYIDSFSEFGEDSADVKDRAIKYRSVDVWVTESASSTVTSALPTGHPSSHLTSPESMTNGEFELFAGPLDRLFFHQ